MKRLLFAARTVASRPGTIVDSPLAGSRLAVFLALALTWTACSASPAGNCGEGARLVGDLCRPVCSDNSECLGSEVCTDSVCVPGTPTSNPDATVVVHDDAAESNHDDATTTGDPDATDRAMDALPHPESDGGVIVVSPDADVPPMNDGGPRRQADLTVTRGPAQPPAPILVLEDFALAATVNNVGDGLAGPTQLGLFLNPEGVSTFVSGTSVLVGNVAVPQIGAAGSRTLSIMARVPNAVPPGRRQLIIAVDPMDVVMERSEVNNAADLGVVDITTITVQPTQVAFGQISSPCGESIMPLSLVNRGTTPVNVQRIGLSPGSSFAADIPPQQPLMLQGGQTVTFAVSFHPRVVGVASATIQVDHEQAGSPIIVPLSGEGVMGTQTITFAPPYQRRADILFVVDELSMSQNELALRASAIIADLSQSAIDYQIGVVGARGLGMSVGDLRGPPFIITPQTPMPAQALSNNLSNNMIGIPGANVGFRAIQTALSGMAGTSGLVREPAWLLVLVLSDGDDATQNASATTVLDQIRALKHDATVGVVGGLLNNGSCGIPGPSTRYMELVRMSGGVTAPVCDPQSWSNVLDALRGSRFGVPYMFSLAPSAPSVQTLSVSVAGAQLPVDAWEYDSMNNLVRILDRDQTPTATDRVEIEFVPVCN